MRRCPPRSTRTYTLFPYTTLFRSYLVLLTLWTEEGQSVGEIGERLMLESSTLTPMLKRLEAAGLIRRARNPDDERQVRIRLTPKGRRLHDRAQAVPPAIVKATQCEAETLGRLRDRLFGVRDAILESVDRKSTRLNSRH